MKYQIICDGYLSLLEHRVNEAIKDGWVPQGGISFDSKTESYLQAMVKQENVSVSN